MNIVNMFPILLHSKIKLIKNIIFISHATLDTKYLWKLIQIRDYMINHIIKSYYYSNILCNGLSTIISNSCKTNLRMDNWNHDLDIFKKFKYISFSGAYELNGINEIYLLINLQNIKIICNNLIILPNTISLLINLKNLYVNHCNLLILPTQISLLINLKNLFIGQNNLRNLPTEIGLLINLQIISVTNNPLYSLPSEIELLNNLHSLHIENCKLLIVPFKIKSLIFSELCYK